jgi:hypothetical protein
MHYQVIVSQVSLSSSSPQLLTSKLTVVANVHELRDTNFGGIPPMEGEIQPRKHKSDLN